MNVFSGHIAAIALNESLSMVSVQFDHGLSLQTIVVETPETASYLRVGNTIQLLFKETEVILAKQDALAISIQNQIPGEIQAIEKGVLLSRVVLSTDIGAVAAVIATAALDALGLEKNQRVIIMIKMNEIMLSR